MIANCVASTFGNGKVCVWLGRSCCGHNLRMVDAGHRSLTDDFGRPISVTSWRRRVVSNRGWCSRQLHRAQHHNNFGVLVFEARVVSIDAYDTSYYEEQNVGCGSEENERPAALEFACMRTGLD